MRIMRIVFIFYSISTISTAMGKFNDWMMSTKVIEAVLSSEPVPSDTPIPIGEPVPTDEPVGIGKPTPGSSVLIILDGNTQSNSEINLMVKAMNTGGVADLGIGFFEITISDLDQNVTEEVMGEMLSQARKFRKLSWLLTIIVMTNSPEFMSTFAESAMNHRLMSGDTRLIALTQLSLGVLRSLIQEHWTYSMMNTVFLNFEDNFDGIRYGIYSNIPYYSTSEAKVVRLASWSPGHGFSYFTSLRLFPAKFKNFQKSKMNVTALPFPPYWNMIQKEDSNGTVHEEYTGTDYLMIDAVAKALNFTIYVLPTANWKEVTQRVKERKSFIATIIYAVFPKRLKDYDYSYMFEYAFHAFTMAKPGLKPQWQSLYYPFTDGVWLAILVVVLFMPLPFLMVNRNVRAQEAIEKNSSIKSVSLLQDIIGTLLGQSLSDRIPQRHSSRLLVGSWLIFAFIVGVAYRGNLTASLTAPKYPARVETLGQLVSDGATVTMPPYGAQFRDYFRESDSEDFKTLGDRVNIVPTALDGVQEATVKRQAHMEARRYLELIIAEKFTKADGSTSLYIGRESVFPGLSAWPIPHDAPFKNTLNRAIMAVIEGGLYEKWSEDLVNQARQESSRAKRELLKQQIADGLVLEAATTGDEAIKALTIVHVQGPLLLLVLGLVTGLVIFLAELLIVWILPENTSNKI